MIPHAPLGYLHNSLRENRMGELEGIPKDKTSAP